VLYYYSGIVFP